LLGKQKFTPRFKKLSKAVKEFTSIILKGPGQDKLDYYFAG
jgi:hypothetical protein